MKKHITNVITAFLINSILGLIAFTDGHVFPDSGFLPQLFGLWLIYVLFIEIWIFAIYIILQLCLVFLRVRFVNVYLGVGIVDFLFRCNGLYSKHQAIIPHFVRDWTIYIPSLSLILIGISYWLHNKYSSQTSPK